MVSDRLRRTEAYARNTMVTEAAHDFKHVNRVRNWAIQIATKEGLGHLVELVEIATLLHDIGLQKTVGERRLHGPVGAEMATEFLRKNKLATEDEIDLITTAIRYHSAAPADVPGTPSTSEANGRGGSSTTLDELHLALVHILRDADAMDALGAVGLMRAFTSKSLKPEYDPMNVLGSTWGLSSRGFDERFASGMGIGDHIVDQINFQMTYFDNLMTEAARQIALPLVHFMKTFLLHLEAEIIDGQSRKI